MLTAMVILTFPSSSHMAILDFIPFIKGSKVHYPLGKFTGGISVR
jgi:hypothetical protein